MIRYEVVCQDASGNRQAISVAADTDEKACAAACEALNTWRPISALPSADGHRRAERAAPHKEPREKKVVSPAEETTAIADPDPVGRVVRKGTLVDVIALRLERSGRRDRGSVGDALAAALERSGS